MPTGFWCTACLCCLAFGLFVGAATERDRASSNKPYEPTGLVQRQEVSMKMAEQTDRLIALLEKKCLPGSEEGFPEDGAQVYNLN